jgi:heparan-alpha-glucosaminide N-acetyltransferase
MNEPTNRLASVDAFRGFTMLAMASAGLSLTALLESRGLGKYAHQLEHEQWTGCTAWDLIQPAFMLLVGVSMPFSFARRQQQGASWSQQFRHALTRALLLALIGMFLDTYSDQIVTIQFIRVLQQIALAYIPAFLILHLRPSFQAATMLFILVMHPFLFIWYAHAQSIGNPWLPGMNVGTWIDKALFVPGLSNYHVSFMPLSKDNYVTLNALSSTATLISGVLAGELLRSKTWALLKFLVLLLTGIGCLYLGLGLTTWVPMIKRLWTTSFAIYAGGWTLILMSGFYLVVDVLTMRSWAFPLVVVGMNSIAMYVFSGVAGSNVKRAVEPFVRLAEMPTEYSLFALAITGLGLKWLFCFWLYRHKIFIRV